MFILITEENVNQYSEVLQDVGLIYQNIDKNILKESIKEEGMAFLLYKDDKHNILGGAKILKPHKNHQINQYFKKQHFSIKSYWLVEDVVFNIPYVTEIFENSDKFESICRKFYTALYQALKLVAHQHGNETFLTLNYLEEHEDIKHFGQWPFIAQHIVAPTASKPQQVLGILSLN